MLRGCQYSVIIRNRIKMYQRHIIFLCVQVFLVKEAVSYAVNGPGIGAPSVIQGNAVTTVTALPTNNNLGFCSPVQTTQVTPLVTEIIPSLNLGDITVGGDIPIGGTIKVSGCFPVYGLVSVDGAVPSAGTAVINAGGGVLAQVIDPSCRVF